MSGLSTLAPPRQLGRLTGLRAVAAAMVFFFHLSAHGVWAPASVTELGYVGVGFFFVLSGFVLTWVHVPGDVGAYARRRWARIYPSHLAVTLVSLILIVPVAKTARGLVASVLLVQAWSSDVTVVFGMNGVSWSLSCEAAFYAGFPLVVFVMRRLAPALRWVVATGVHLAAVGFVAASSSMAARFEVWAFSHPAVRFSEFLLGVVAALAIREGWRPRLALWHGLAMIVVTVMLVEVAPVEYPLPNQLMAPAFLATIIAAAVADDTGRRGWLSHRTLIYAGELSYAFYLVHELVIINIQRRLGLTGLALALLVAGMSVVAAAALHHAVERPCRAWIRGDGRGRRSAPMAAGVEIGGA